MPRVRLTHLCNAPRAKGLKGDVLDVDEATAMWLLSVRGATLVAPPTSKEKPHGPEPLRPAGDELPAGGGGKPKPETGDGGAPPAAGRRKLRGGRKPPGPAAAGNGDEAAAAAVTTP